MHARHSGLALAALLSTSIPAASFASATLSSPAPSLALSLVEIANSSSERSLEREQHQGFGDRLESIRYRPRWRQRERERGDGGQTTGYVQFHGGFLSPSDDQSNAALFGMRVGSNMDDHVQLGLGMDWSHRSDHQSTVIGSGTLPGGQPVERRVDLASVSSDLLPVLAFVQIAPTGSRAGGPYVGIAGGWEALFVSAQDFNTQEDFDATYTGWGWQFYGGFAFPLSSTTRINLEGFTNSGDLDRDVHDPVTGQEYREIVDAGGAGLRAGVSFGF